MSINAMDVEEIYKKDEKLMREDVEALKEWARKEQYLPQLSDLRLALFLHSCYYSLEAAKRTIEAFFLIKHRRPDFFANRNPSHEHLVLAMQCATSIQLPTKTPEGYSVLLYTYIDANPQIFNFPEQIKLWDMSMRLWLEENGPTEGLVILVDFEKFSFAHLAKVAVPAMRDLLIYLQDGLPVRLKGLHYINSGAVIEKLMLIMKPFLKKELSEMFFTHKDVSESLFKYVPRQVLPKDIGGEEGTFKDYHDILKKRLLANTKYFLEEEKEVADFSKMTNERRRSSVTEDFLVDGSFRKLSID